MSLLILFPTGNTAENNKLTLPPDFITMDTEGGSLRQHDGITQGGYIHHATFPPPPFQGEVPVTELINGIDLATLVGLTAGTAINDNEPWLKFYDEVDRKTKYISKKPYRYNLSWDQLNAVGIVSGKQITIGSNQYICRLIKSGTTDPMDATSGYDTEPTHGSEWNRLMYRITVGGANDAVYVTSTSLGDWAQYMPDELGLLNNGQHSWCQEISEFNSVNRITRNNGNISYINSFVSSNIVNLNLGWRPLLELVE